MTVSDTNNLKLYVKLKKKQSYTLLFLLYYYATDYTKLA